MEKWFYEMYGIPYSNFVNNVYIHDKLRYEIFAIADIEKIEDHSMYTTQMAQELDLPPIVIVMNKKQEPYSNYQGNWYMVLRGENTRMSFEHIERMHQRSKNAYGVSIVGMSELWLERLTHIEENILPTLPSLLKYEEVLANIYIALSVGESALHYLRFIQEETLPSCLTHARLSYLDSFYVLNPLYCKVDHECRDYVELYNAQLIDRQQVLDLLEFKQYSKDELLYMVARLLFPTTFFDYLEELFIAQEWELRYIYDLPQDMKHKSELAIEIMERYTLLPISYLFSFLT